MVPLRMNVLGLAVLGLSLSLQSQHAMAGYFGLYNNSTQLSQASESTRAVRGNPAIGERGPQGIWVDGRLITNSFNAQDADREITRNMSPQEKERYYQSAQWEKDYLNKQFSA
ncbi:hypothetical protein BJ085DRAFT_30809 [Dimargaris cristalligena]|uniref:Uncharacterized protein n=1 Tax=Dimargaris cristalligena TaxID=215637 RepID=A0A4P9ZKY5_9FUNG|nr:hypothetical protein BJ085DRAFT_30809 [Dimargaris cristalligena]|eukprot:RKP33232.1 hypothetical protein BJ085DRAFT_30809 [Dimargaris cristalligena]